MSLPWLPKHWTKSLVLYVVPQRLHDAIYSPKEEWRNRQTYVLHPLLFASAKCQGRVVYCFQATVAAFHQVLVGVCRSRDHAVDDDIFYLTARPFTNKNLIETIFY